MKKRCPYCGRFMNAALHGACFSCLRSTKRLGPALKVLFEQLQANHFVGKEKKSVQNIIKCVNTLLFDGEWFAYRWNPKGNLEKVLSTTAERPYLTPAMIAEIEQIVEGIDEEEGQRRA